MLSDNIFRNIALSDLIWHFISSNFSEIIIILIVFILIKLLIREIRCWYWKINDRVTIGNQQVNLLIEIIENQDEEISILNEILGRVTNPDGVSIEYIKESAATEDDPE